MPAHKHTDAIFSPSALHQASLSVEGALRGELTDRLLRSGLDVAQTSAISQRLHARVVRVDEQTADVVHTHTHPHHGFALVLMAGRDTFKAGLPARGCLEELTEQLINTHRATCHEAVLPTGTLQQADADAATHPGQPSLHDLDVSHNCMMFGPTESLPLDSEGKANGRVRSVLFARSIPDLLSGINTVLASNRQINLSLHEGRSA